MVIDKLIMILKTPGAMYVLGNFLNAKIVSKKAKG
jgi:hypothetical protein